MNESQPYSTDDVYTLYRKEIADIVAYIEVYEHDLPPVITGQIAELFTSIAVFEADDQEMRFNGLKQSSEVIVQAIRFYAIFLFIHEIQEFEKLFRKYHYKGAIIPNSDLHVYNEIRKMEKDIIPCFKEKLKDYYRSSFKGFCGTIFNSEEPYGINDLFRYIKGYMSLHFKRSIRGLNKPYLPSECLVNSNEDYVDLSKDYEEFKGLLAYYEEHMPDVINSGPKQGVLMNTFIAVTSWFIPIAVSIPTIIFIAEKGIHILEAVIKIFGK